MNVTRTVLAAVIVAAVLVPAAASQGRADDAVTFPPCSTDEGPDGQRGCVWDAVHNGNGTGQSYYVGRGGTVYPLPHRVAHALVTR